MVAMEVELETARRLDAAAIEAIIEEQEQIPAGAGADGSAAEADDVAFDTTRRLDTGVLMRQKRLDAAEADDVAFDNEGAAKGLNDNAHGIDRFGYRVRS